MQFELDQSREVLSQTPAVFSALLKGKSVEWLQARKTPDAFSAIDVLGHLMHAEMTDWMPRVHLILENRDAKPFDPFDRFAFQPLIEGRSLGELLAEFARLRQQSLDDLDRLDIGEVELDLPGLHPALGPVTLRNLLATWVVHDLGHIAQVVKTMANEYRDAVGPWRAYTTILDS